MFSNKFVQSLGVAAFVYLLLRLTGWGFDAFLRMLESFARWYRYSAVPWSEEIAIAAGLLFLLVSAFFSSRSSRF
jgi:hypothetical protein